MRFIKKNLVESLSRVILVSFLILVPVLSFAQVGQNPPTYPVGQNPPADAGKIVNPLGPGTNSIQDFIHTLLTGALRVGIPIVALAIIYCGFLFVSARGNAEKLSTAKSALMYTLIGAAILLGSYAIATMISGTVLAL